MAGCGGKRKSENQPEIHHCHMCFTDTYTQVRCTEYNNSVEYSAKRRGNRQDIDRIAATGHLGRGPELHRTLAVITS